MIKGYVFSNQLASNDIDSMIFRKMLDYNDGILNGFEISNTNTIITIGQGNFLIAGRPVGIIGSETVTATTDIAYCKLVLEIDLSNSNTNNIRTGIIQNNKINNKLPRGNTRRHGQRRTNLPGRTCKI